MRASFIIPLLLFAFAGRAALGAGMSVTLAADHTVAQPGDEIQLQLTVTNGRAEDAPVIENAEPAFELRQAGTSQQFRIANGESVSSTVYLFVATPKKAGNFTLGPARLRIGGKDVRSNALQIQVAAGQAGNAAKAGAPFRVEAKVDTATPYAGQQVTYTFRLLSRGRLHNPQLQLGDFKGVTKEELGRAMEGEALIDGVRWEVTELKFALFPMAPGEVELPPATLIANVEVPGTQQRRSFFDDDSFFDNMPFFGGSGRLKRLQLRTEAIKLHVLPLPEPRPPGFTGLVGRFQLTANVGKDTLAVGDSTTLSVELSGEGNVRDAKLPPPPPGDFKVYDDQPVTRPAVTNGRVGGVKSFKRALVPLKPGRHEIPRIEVPYFDTGTKAYAVAASAPVVLNVTGGSPEDTAHATASPTGGKTEVKVRGEDIMPVRVLADPEASSLVPALGRWFVLALALVGGPLGWLLARWAGQQRNARRGDAGRRRREGAYRKFLADRSMAASDPFMASSALLRGYLGDKFDFDGLALTPLDLDRRLRPLGLSPETLQETEAILKLCERGQYGGGGMGGEALAERVAALVARVEKEARA